MRELWPEAKFEEREATPAGVHPDKAGVIKFTVNVAYFRAIAKIAFHYYLSHSKRGYTGGEEEFAPLRRFIMFGGETDQFFRRSGRSFAVPFGELPEGGVATPTKWCHVLGADESRDVVVVYVQLFVGPGCVPPPHYVSLGPIRSPLVVPNPIWGHTYTYEPSMRGRCCGTVKQLAVHRFRTH